MSFSIRKTKIEDVPVIISLIKELATYEKLAHEMLATVEDFEKALFGEHKCAETVLGEVDGKAVAVILFFHNFSTFVGRPGLYLEDLFVKPEFRGRGFGKKMLLHLVSLAKERGCGRVEWAVLDWNQPAIDFYQSLGAKPMEDWTIFRLTEDKIKELG
jgi:GNAT superfamily N-acetyltransferase